MQSIIRDFEPGSGEIREQRPLQSSLPDLQERLIQAKGELNAEDFSVTKQRSPDAEIKTMIVTFANFLQLENSREHTWATASSAAKNFGKVLSHLSYFDYDSVSSEQEDCVKNY